MTPTEARAALKTLGYTPPKLAAYLSGLGDDRPLDTITRGIQRALLPREENGEVAWYIAALIPHLPPAEKTRDTSFSG